MFFFMLISFVILQRLVELMIAKRNERQLKKRGALEFGAEHYPWMVLLHTGFFTVLMIEVIVFERPLSALWFIWFSVFVLAQIGRVWVIRSLGEYWNTKIIVLPGAKVITRGPYTYVRHPNYVIVATEIIAISLLFNAICTVILFSLLNVWMMKVRIRAEEQALTEYTEYAFKFSGK